MRIEPGHHFHDKLTSDSFVKNNLEMVIEKTEMYDCFCWNSCAMLVLVASEYSRLINRVIITDRLPSPPVDII